MPSVVVSRNRVEGLELREVLLHERHEVPFHTLGESFGIFELRAAVLKRRVSHGQSADEPREFREQLLARPEVEPSIAATSVVEVVRVERDVWER